MPKAYWIAHVKVTDAENYKQYIDTARPAFEEYGARFIVRGGRHETAEGNPGGDRHVVIEFDSYDQALACYRSAQYQKALQFRKKYSTGTLAIVEGVA